MAKKAADQDRTSLDQGRRKRSKFSPTNITLVVWLCCGLNIVVTLFQGSLLQSVDRSEHPGFMETHGRRRPILSADRRMAQLTCDAYGGPLDKEATDEMVYWQDIPEDSKFKSPFLESGTQRYLTFEPDIGGFNNVRMSMETVIAIAHATGRTLVLPPEQNIYLLNKQSGTHKKSFSFADFFPLDTLSSEQDGLDIISTNEFLRREGIAGNLKDGSGQTSYPPNNRTDWNGMQRDVTSVLEPWLQNISVIPSWNPEDCMVAFPTSRKAQNSNSLQLVWDDVMKSGGFPAPDKFIGTPSSVRSSSIKRLYENNKERASLCIYNETLQQAPLLHLPGKNDIGGRLLVHFYAFLFFEDWKQDLWTKRFVRDHLRYVDEIQCAAARIVHAIRKRAMKRSSQNKYGIFDAFHVRRGDFQYKKTRVSAQDMYDISKDEIPDGMTVYIATDEKDKDFFNNMATHFDLVFLDDFKDLLENVNPNLFGMIDQLVASRSRVFFGCWFSTFTGYINRIRGYHADRHKLPGFENGIIESYYYAPSLFKNRMKEFWPVSGATYAREFPVSWRNIDQGIGQMVSN